MTDTSVISFWVQQHPTNHFFIKEKWLFIYIYETPILQPSFNASDSGLTSNFINGRTKTDVSKQAVEENN
jgi:hypothetical protein